LKKLPVLFIPGTLCTPNVFNSQVKALEPLAAQIDVVRFALEDSISEMADTAIKHIDPKVGSAIVGFSMGGMVAMEIARQAPELIKKLALLNTNLHADLPGRQLARLQHLKEASTSSMGDIIRQYYLDRYLYQAHPEAGKQIITMANNLGTKCFAAQINALATRLDSRDVLANIKCPTLILGASEDELCPQVKQRQMQQTVKNSELKILDACGHFSILEKPPEVNHALQDWYLQEC
jgi:pimeloyl-ACP methyl ester carboxylesterase